MRRDLPEDLSLLGDELTAAAARGIAARRRRNERAARVAATAGAAALAFAAIAPGPLEPSERDGPSTLLIGGTAGCHYPRGEWQTMKEACAGTMILHRPYAWR
jgi:hypothetical protein